MTERHRTRSAPAHAIPQEQNSEWVALSANKSAHEAIHAAASATAILNFATTKCMVRPDITMLTNSDACTTDSAVNVHVHAASAAHRLPKP